MGSVANEPILEIFKYIQKLEPQAYIWQTLPNVPTTYDKTELHKHNPCMRKLPIYASYIK